MAATINYRYAGQGTGNGFVAGTVPPTTAQAADISLVTAQVIFGDGDTTAAVVHNMQVAGFGLGYGFPTPLFRVAAATGTTAVTTPPTVTLTDSNTVTVAKAAATGSGFTGELAIYRPNTLMQ